MPLLFDEEQQRYSIPETYFLPPTSFTPDEALAVLVLCQELGDTGQLPFYAAAQTAAIKLESSLPEPLREHVREASPGVNIALAPRNQLEGRQGTYYGLLGCIARKQSAQIRYDSFAEGGMIETKLSPYRLLFSRRSWYVIGRSACHRQVRTFNVGRIEHLEPLQERFQIPRTFSIDRYLGNAWHLIPEPGPDWRVVIRFAKLVARNVAEIAWHKSQRPVFNPDGTMDFHVTISGLNEISWWVLGYGDQAEVLEPAELREIVSRRAAKIVEIYRKTTVEDRE